jgi:hypothetical protein
MTRAVCVNCGQGKAGAFTRCVSCHYDPEKQGKEAQARSLLLSDRYLTVSQLKEASRQIRSGEPYGFQEDTVGEVAAKLPDRGANARLGLLVGGIVGGLALLLVLLVIGLFLALRVLI